MGQSRVAFVEGEVISTQRGLWQNGYVLALLAASAASLKAILVKLAYAAAPVSPVALLTLRMALSLPFFIWLYYAASRRAGAAPLTRRQGALLVLMAFLGYYFSSLSNFIGLQTISVGLERLIQFTYPSFIVLLEWRLRGHRMRRATLLGLGLSYLGLAIAFAHDVRLGDSAAVLMGSAWVLASAISYALYHVGAVQLIKGIGAGRFAGGAGVLASLMIFTHGAVTEDVQHYAQLPATVWWAAGAMAVLCTVVPSFLNARAMALIGASQTGAVGNLGPVLTIALGWVVLAEPFSLPQLLGMALVLFGVRQLSR